MDNKYFFQSISFNRGVAWATSIDAAILYNELLFFSDKGIRADGWVWKKYTELQDRLPLSEYQIRKAYKQLVKEGYIETKIMKAYGFPTLHYRILKNFRIVSEKTKETMETKKTSETIYSNTPLENPNISNVNESEKNEDSGKGYELAKRKAQLIRKKAIL